MTTQNITGRTYHVYSPYGGGVELVGPVSAELRDCLRHHVTTYARRNDRGIWVPVLGCADLTRYLDEAVEVICVVGVSS